jgi:radical SAM superfamily enzyme YgiQ (UPF0313 family)
LFVLIILSTFNARFTHTSIGLRYLYANLKELQKQTRIMEFVINENSQSIAEKILECQPKIVGIGVYIWNAVDVKNLIEIIKKISPSTIIVLGGPEVSHLPLRVDFGLADFIICGEGELSFYELCGQILDGNAPRERMIRTKRPNLKEIAMPYEHYTDEDIKHRYVYVEASRGCPFECEFCLSSIDEKVSYFDTDKLLEEFEILWQRGARNFKFIDRTFNLNITVADKLFDFFLAKEPPYFLHFEVIPDAFPQRLRNKISRFPSGSLQLEIGIQTLNEKVAARINRKIDLKKIKQNITFLQTQTNAHMHLDLIVGLPGESLNDFGQNLNTLCSLTKSEIQIGILKKLSGTSIGRHDEECKMVYSDTPPYDILQNSMLSFAKIQKMKRFARFWDIAYNSGNFNKTVELLWCDEDVFAAFYRFSEWVYEETESTWQIALNRFAELLFNYLTVIKKHEKKVVAEAIIEDIARVDGRSLPAFLKDYASSIPAAKTKELAKFAKRQQARSE